MTLTEALTKRFPNQVLALTPGSVLVEQGKPCDSLFLVLEGTLDVWVERGDKSTRVGEVRGDGIVGDASMSPGPAPETVRANRPAAVLRLSRGLLDVLWLDAPEIALAIVSLSARHLAARLRTSSQRLVSLAGHEEATPWTSSAA